MSNVELKRRKVGILVAPGFDDGQVIRTIEILRDMKAEVMVSSQGEVLPGPVAGMRGALLNPNVQLSRLPAASLDAVIIAGGNSTAALQSDTMALTLLMELQAAGKPIGAVGSGAMVLASAGLVNGMRVTGEFRTKRALEHHGAFFLGQGLVVDHNIVTSQSEQNLLHFIEAIAFLLEPAPTLR